MHHCGIYAHRESVSRIKGKKPEKAIQDIMALWSHFSTESTIPLRKVAIDSYLSVHAPRYLDGIITLSKGEMPDILPLMSMECNNLCDFLPGYEFGLGGIFEAVDRMKKGVLERAWCLALPGHHAHPAFGHGYCLLNTQAAGIRYAQQNGFRNILVVDWDIHHGDGTQTIFENDPSVFQISIHSAVDLYMNKMEMTLRGYTTYGSKVGHCNIPVLNQFLGEAFYYEVMGDQFSGKLYDANNCLTAYREALENLPFSPDMIFIFDGHDSHCEDQGRGITDWTDKDFVFLTQTILEVSGKYHCPVISCPSGGYRQESLHRLTRLHLELMKNYRPATN